MQTSSKENLFKGVYTAIVTPFQRDGSIDWKAYERLVDLQLEGGVHGIIPCGTTGESPTLTSDEKKQLVERTVKKAKGRALVIAGTGSNDTAKTIDDSRKAAEVGADALLVVTPYYNKPSQAGMEEHYRAVADAVSIPLILYNVPGRTGVSLTAATVARLAAHPRIVGIKEATANLGLLTEMRNAVSAALGSATDRFVYLSGDDITFWPFLACGGDGIISVASNVLPRSMRALYDAWVAGRLETGLELHERLSPLFNALFIEANPVPVKTILGWQNRIDPRLRLPLSAIAPENGEKLRKVWNALPAHLREDEPRTTLE